jgi:hypothetical protein
LPAPREYLRFFAMGQPLLEFQPANEIAADLFHRQVTPTMLVVRSLAMIGHRHGFPAGCATTLQ